MEAPFFSILHESSDWIAIDKPAALLVHPSPLSRKEDSAQMILERQLGTRLLGVHRLDRPTSGVLLFAKNTQAAARISEAFRNRLTQKHYFAIVRGHLAISDQWTLIDRPLTKILKNGEHSDRKPARSFYRVTHHLTFPYPIGKYPEARYSGVEVRIETGLTHQIRRHLAGISHPIIGDTIYGDGRHNQATRKEWGLHRLFLHSTRLAIPELEIDLVAPVPSAWNAVLSSQSASFPSGATQQGENNAGC